MHSQAGCDSNLQISPPWIEGAHGWGVKRWWGVVYASNFNSTFHLGPGWGCMRKEVLAYYKSWFKFKEKNTLKTQKYIPEFSSVPSNLWRFPKCSVSYWAGGWGRSESTKMLVPALLLGVMGQTTCFHGAWQWKCKMAATWPGCDWNVILNPPRNLCHPWVSAGL